MGNHEKYKVLIINDLNICIVIESIITQSKMTEMNKHEINTDEWFDEMNDHYFLVKNKEHGFYWVINLNDHPNSFLLDHSFQNMVTPGAMAEEESMVVIQPNFS